MVTVEAIDDDNETQPSEERLLDAKEIEEAAAKMTRPTARMHLEALAKKLRKESEALKRLEASKQKVQEDGAMQVDSNSAAPPVLEEEKAQHPSATPTVPAGAMYVPIDRFSFDAGKYDSPFVTLYVGLPGVGSIDRSKIECNFSTSSFDLVVHDLNGKSYRLFKDNLENDIDTNKSKIVVKADKVLVKLAKIKKEYGSYDYWSKLTDTKKRGAKKEDPSKSIMDLMKNMYEEGDDNMKKIIGETMMKQQRGELGKGADFGNDMDLGGL